MLYKLPEGICVFFLKMLMAHVWQFTEKMKKHEWAYIGSRKGVHYIQPVFSRMQRHGYLNIDEKNDQTLVGGFDKGSIKNP